MISDDLLAPLPADWQLRVAAHRPVEIRHEKIHRRAATAVVCVERGPGGPELVFMRRAHRDGDPWSGQISFPGGHWDDSDQALADTARREAHEELGLELGAPLGRLDDRPVHTGPHTVVTPFVFALESRPALIIDPREVSAGLFVPIRRLIAVEHRTVYRHRRPEYHARYPGIELENGSVLWGLTYRSVVGLLELFDYSLPREA